MRPAGTWQDLGAGQRPRSNCSKYNAKGGMRFAFPPYRSTDLEKESRMRKEIKEGRNLSQVVDLARLEKKGRDVRNITILSLRYG